MNNLERIIDKHYKSLISIFSILMIAFVLMYSNMFFQFTMDDSFISFRYAENLGNGYGLVFNVNELPRAEGITSPLYAFVLSIGSLGSFNLLMSSKIFGLFSLGLVLVIIIQMAKLFYSQNDFMSEKTINIIALIPALIYVSDPYVIGNAVSGMETMFGTLIFTLFIYQYLRITIHSSYSNVNMTLLGIFAFLVPLIRPELALGVIALLGLSFLFLPRLRKKIGLSIGIFAVLGISYFVWRYSYYELFFPLPFYIKQGGQYALPGLYDVIYFLGHYSLQLLLVAVSAIYVYKSRRSYSKVFFIILAAIAIQMSYYLFIRHIMGFGYRYFQPFMAIGIVFAALSMPYLLKKRTLALLFIALILLFNIFSTTKAYDLYVSKYGTLGHNMSQIAKTLASLEHKYSIAINDCGVLPFYTKWETVDLAGLNNRNIALGYSRETSIEELKKRDVDLIVLVGFEAHGKLTKYEKMSKQDIADLGYEYLGSMAILSDYHWLLYGKREGNYDPVIKSLHNKGLILPPVKE